MSRKSPKPRTRHRPTAAAAAPGKAALDAPSWSIIGYALLLIAVFLGMAAWSWLKWPDPLVDFGRELYVPWQITEGRVLYRDIAYFNGPLSPYFNALMFTIFGVSLRGLMLVNLGMLAILTWLIWRLWQQISDAFTATVACIVLLTVFSFIQLGGIGNYNFVAPYSHEVTHGIILSFAGIACIAEYMRRIGAEGLTDARKRRLQIGWFGAVGLIMGLIFLTKSEVFVAASIALVFGVVMAARQARQPSGQSLGIFAIGAVVPPVVAVVLLWTAMPASQAFGGTLGSWRYIFDARITSLPFYRKILGIDDPAGSATAILVCSVCYAAVLAGAYGVTLLRKRDSMIWAGVAAVAVVVVARFALPLNIWQQSLRGLTFAAPAIAVWTVLVAIRQRDERSTLCAILAVFAAVLLAKSAFNVLSYHYGFALAMPATLIAIAAGLNWFPRLIAARGRAGFAMRAVIVPFIGLFVFVHLYIFGNVFSRKTVLVGRGADSFLSDPAADRRGEAVNIILSELRTFPGGSTLAVVPDGVMINFLSTLANPTRYTNLMPPEVLMYGQDQIIAEFQAHPPDVIILNQFSDASEYGLKGFTEDYGAAIWNWIQANYIEIPSPLGEGFRFRTFRRN